MTAVRNAKGASTSVTLGTQSSCKRKMTSQQTSFTGSTLLSRIKSTASTILRSFLRRNLSNFNSLVSLISSVSTVHARRRAAAVFRHGKCTARMMQRTRRCVDTCDEEHCVIDDIATTIVCHHTLWPITSLKECDCSPALCTFDACNNKDCLGR